MQLFLVLAALLVAALGGNSSLLAHATSNPGLWVVIGTSGVPAMHVGCLPNGRCTLIDKVENFTYSVLPTGRFAYSVEYDPTSGSVVPLALQTNPFCAGGCLLADGRLLVVGGNAALPNIDPTIGDGFNGIRFLSRTTDGRMNGQSWDEPGMRLALGRWYPSVQRLNDSSIFVCSGSLNAGDPTDPDNNNPTYELLNPRGFTLGRSYPMPLLISNQPVFMYPIIHMLSDGTLFICVNKSCQIVDPFRNRVIRSLPDIPGMTRTYPNAGSSLMLPLSSKNNWQAEILICGGGEYQDITSPTDNTCARINPYDQNPQWEIDFMPYGRVMSDMVMHPNGDIAILNGANRGAQGFGLATNPTTEMLWYWADKPQGMRITRGANSTIPRLYHSVAFTDDWGRLIVAGSNPNEMVKLSKDPSTPFITDFRIETLRNWIDFRNLRSSIPHITGVTPGYMLIGSSVVVKFDSLQGSDLLIALEDPGFNTHSLKMNHRFVILDTTGFVQMRKSQVISVKVPPNHNVAPAGLYRLWVVVDNLPAQAYWIEVR